MSLGKGLFFFLLVLCFLIGMAFVPIRLRFYIKHRHVWDGSVVIHVGAIEKTIQLSGQKDADAAHFLQKYYEKWSEKWNTTSHSLQIHWQSVLAFFCKAVQIVTRRISVEQFVIDCKIGCQRADYTAYGYGLFWALLSFVPEKLFRNAEITYIPDFQTVRKDILIQGIICMRAGQLIGIVIALFRLTVQMMLKQNREEQMGYEN